MSMRTLIHVSVVALIAISIAIPVSGCGSSSASAQNPGLVVEEVDGLLATSIAPLNSSQVVFWGRTTQTGFDGYEPWVSDGTAAGTVRVKDIFPGATESMPDNVAPFIVVNERAYFVANDGTNGWSLWSTDGTESGTRIESVLLPPDVQLALEHGDSMNRHGNQIFISGFDLNYQNYFFAITIN